MCSDCWQIWTWDWILFSIGWRSRNTLLFIGSEFMNYDGEENKQCILIFFKLISSFEFIKFFLIYDAT